jgi:NADH dehydrogenase/NADH:ubiquinone oxidoreductase subunit G
MSELLAQDHAQLDRLFSELCVAFKMGEVRSIHQRLDQFWARLAVHIRAEHLGLFPATLNALSSGANGAEGAPSLSEAQQAIEELRRDHDFFMHELSRAIKSVRGLLTTSDNQRLGKELKNVEASMAAVAERLETHNKFEEERIYLWSGEILTEAQQSELASRVQAELSKMPPRFASQS